MANQNPGHNDRRHARGATPRRAGAPTGAAGRADARSVTSRRAGAPTGAAGRPDSRPAASSQPAGEARRQLAARRRASMRAARGVSVRACCAVLVAGFALGLALFARPTTSAAENRELTAFPEFSLGGFLDGSFTGGITTWYADTYPFRDQLVSANKALTSLFGVDSGTKMVGGNVKTDEIPDVPTVQDNAAPAEPQERQQVDPPTEGAMAADVQANIMKGLYVKNGAVYGIYYFSQESVQAYAAALNDCATQLAGKAQVYSILVPNNSAVMLDPEECAKLGGTDQGKAISYFDSLFDPSIKTVDILDTLRAHNSEYLYFRTDHHWTELGAFYAYQKFCEVKGIDAVPLEGKKKYEFGPFLGTYYSELGDASLAQNPDTVEAWVPNDTNDMTYWDTEGNQINANIVTDVTGWAKNSYYNCFIAGDRPLTVIHNSKVTDGSSCLVIKDSYGCAFVPLLVDNYEDVYVIDFRYSSQNIPQFVEEKGVKDVIFMNNISLAGTLTVANKLQSMM